MVSRINPYIAGAPVVEERMFFGRKDIFTWIERSLSGRYVDHILVIHGQRRVGKTSVLKHLSNRLPERYIPVFLDLQGRVNTTLDRFLWWLAREITRALKQERNIEIERPAREAFQHDGEYFETHFLANIEKQLGDHRLLLTFDEFDTLESPGVSQELALPFMEILKRLMEHEKMNFIFSIGSSGRKLENMRAAYTGFFKQALYKKVSFLSEADSHNLIVKPVEGVIKYSPSAVQRIHAITSGHPYFVQLVCHELFSVCQKHDHWQVSLSDVDDVLKAVVERGTVNLKFVWDEAGELEKWVLVILAFHNEVARLDELEVYLRGEQVQFAKLELESALLHLRQKDVLTEKNGFVNELLRLWLRENRPIEQVRDEMAGEDPVFTQLMTVAQSHQRKEEYESAIAAYEQALEHEREDRRALLGLGESRLALKNYKQAVSVYVRMLERDRDDVAAQAGTCNAYLAWGKELLSAHKYAQAENAFGRVIEINAQHQGAMDGLALVRRRRWQIWRRPAMWGTAGIIVLVFVGGWLYRTKPNLFSFFQQPTPTQAARLNPTQTPPPVTVTASPSPSVTSSPTPSPSPTAIPLSWQRINSLLFLTRGEITDIVADPEDQDIFYVGTSESGIYVSIDGGISWQPAFSSLGNSEIGTISIDPNNPSVIYVTVLSGEIFKSTDRGESWRLLGDYGDFELTQFVKATLSYSPTIDDAIPRLVIDHSDSSHLWYTNVYYLYESFDGGDTWQKIERPSGCPMAFENLEINPNNSAIYTNNTHCQEYSNAPNPATEFYVSTNGGHSWEFKSTVGKLFLRFSVLDDGRIVTNVGETSEDNGHSWNKENFNPSWEAGGETHNYGNSEQSTNEFYVSPHNARNMLVGTYGLAITTNGGQNWEGSSNGIGNNRVRLIANPTNPDKLYLLSSVGTFISNDAGTNWDFLTNSREFKIGADGQTILNKEERSNDGGYSWTLSKTFGIHVHPYVQGLVFGKLSGQNELWRSTDYGETWERILDNFSINIDIAGMGFDRLGLHMYIFDSTAGYYTDDGGFTWHDCNPEYASVVGDTAPRFSSTLKEAAPVFTVDLSNPERVMMGTRGSGVLLSEDSCQSWQIINNGIEDANINTIAIDPQNSNLVYVGTDEGVYISFDGGSSWEQINDGLLGALIVYSILINPIEPYNIYATTPYGIFRLEEK